MSVGAAEQWYLVRTKPGKERWVRDQLSIILPQIFLPMLKARIPRWGKLSVSLTPLFPCYVFARLDLTTHYFEVKYLPGVHGLVSAGSDPLAVPEQIVQEIRLRGVNNVVEIHQQPFDSGQAVRVVDGPFRGFDAIFDRYLSGPERVAILLNTVQSAGLRVVLSASALAKCS